MSDPTTTQADALAMGLATPLPNDQLHRGDDAITLNARHLADTIKATAAAKAAADAAPAKIRAELDPDTIVRGRASAPQTGDTAWRQTTEDGYLLPLGYRADGHLDEFAVTMFKGDLMNAENVTDHPDYARVWITDDGTNRLILGVKWDGTVEIPGLAGGSAAAPARTYTDAPYTYGSDLLPVRVDMTRWAIWGSSSSAGITTELTGLAAGHGAAFYGGGKGSERVEQIAARLGSTPFLLVPADGSLVIPGSGAVLVTETIGSPTHQYLRGYYGTWAGVRGMLQWDAAAASLRFTRSTAGDPVTLTGPAPLIPEDGHAQRDALTLLWMGKNNTGSAGSAEKVISYTDDAHDWLAPLQKRVLVLGHFVDSTQGPTSTQRTNVYAINAAHAARYGDTFVDVQAYLTGPQVWTDTGITPTTEDTTAQAAGNLPPSLANDPMHMNAAGYAAVRALIAARMSDLGWI